MSDETLMILGYDGDASGYGPEECDLAGWYDCSDLLGDWVQATLGCWDTVIAKVDFALRDIPPRVYRDNGLTRIRIRSFSLYGTDRTCFACDGTGEHNGEECPRCEGYGIVDSPPVSGGIYREINAWARDGKVRLKPRKARASITDWVGDRLWADADGVRSAFIRGNVRRL